MVSFRSFSFRKSSPQNFMQTSGAKWNRLASVGYPTPVLRVLGDVGRAVTRILTGRLSDDLDRHSEVVEESFLNREGIPLIHFQTPHFRTCWSGYAVSLSPSHGAFPRNC